MKIRLIGQRNNLGVGIHYGEFANAIRQVYGVGHLIEEIDHTNQPAVEQAIQSSAPNDINISFISGNIHELFRGHTVQWTVFESDKIPSTMLNNLQQADSVWVPSQWGNRILVANGIDPDKIHVVPEGVNPNEYNLWSRPVQVRPYRFLFVGKYEQRKSCHEVVEAFAKEWHNNPEVELVLKTHQVSEEHTLTELEQQLARLELTNIHVIVGNIDQMQSLYRVCDAMIAPTKGEGWGLPIIEAAASGLPIVATNYSGHTEYLQHITNSVVPVDYKLGPIDCPIYQSHYPEPSGDWGQWAISTVDDIAQAMVLCKNHKDFLAENALKNSRVIRTKFSWENSVELALQNLQDQGLLTG
jgi:glycosyltransferase involved in cell wall biosynthesis